MESEEHVTFYEELRKKNIERNENIMRMLGLIPPRCDEEQKQKAPRSQRTRSTLKKGKCELRRSARIASTSKSSVHCRQLSRNSCALAARGPSCTKAGAQRSKLKKKIGASAASAMEEEMEQHHRMEDAYSTDSSFESLYGMEMDLNIGNRDSIQQNFFRTMTPGAEFATSSSGVTLDCGKTEGATIFGNQFQELVIRALMQSTMSSIVPPPGVMVAPQDGSIATPLLSLKGAEPPETWNEATYNMVEARRKLKTQMTRTSAGEGSDSQEEFPVPQNENPQQRSLRTRRLNRSRARRAKDLTSNRKALKKLPHVIFVDGTAKARGIHRHLWRAAVRGQCGRLDPTMDNINHHSKHVVDSIWHALEKEWEFEGFAHRAREMFERSATKFMRNRKMQLKYKCQKNVTAPKPGDISPAHWAKIVDLTNKSGKPTTFGRCNQNSAKGKEQVSTDEKENWGSVFSQVVVEQDRESRILESGSVKSEFVFVEDEDVDARIRSLQTELLRLQNSRKVGFRVDRGGTTGTDESGEIVVFSAEDTVLKEMKENIMPYNGKGQEQLQVTLGTTENKRNEEVQGKLLCASKDRKSSLFETGKHEIQVQQSRNDINNTEIDCGDVVRLFAFTGGRKEEIGRGIVMGLPGSMYAKKEIPQGWHSLKVTSYNSAGASKVCPFPAGWTEQLKYQTVKEVNCRTILWPDMLLRSLVQL